MKRPAVTATKPVEGEDQRLQQLESLLRAFYEAKNPEHLGQVGSIARRFVDNQGALFAALDAKYGTDLAQNNEQLRRKQPPEEHGGDGEGASELLCLGCLFLGIWALFMLYMTGLLPGSGPTKPRSLAHFSEKIETAYDGLRGSSWRWGDGKARVSFLADGSFSAPSCAPARSYCRWSANRGFVWVAWGAHKGLHRCELSQDGTKLDVVHQSGMRWQAWRLEAGASDASLYDALEIEPGATAADIKKAFRRLSLRYHPDKVPPSRRQAASAKYEAVGRANGVLSLPAERAIYDAGGLELLSRVGRGEARRGQDRRVEQHVSLELLFSGGELRTTVSRRVVCRGCARTRCEGCGDCPPQMRVVTNRHANGMFFRQQVKVPSSSRCRNVPLELEVVVEPGASDGHEVVFKHLADQTPGAVPGHIVVVLKEQPHPVLQRRGHDLLIDVKLSLKESLSGFSRELLTRHVDGAPLLLSASKVTAHQSKAVIRGRGLPIIGARGARGDVRATFFVTFPSDPLDALTRSFFEEYGDQLRY